MVVLASGSLAIPVGALSGRPGSSGIVTFAEPPGLALNYIFPFDPITSSTVNNVKQFQALMWRPLGWFGTNETAARADPSLSLYSSVVYSDHVTKVTVHLKPYRWSDGRPLTSRDVEFSYDLYRYNEVQWSQWVPGQFPDNVASVHLPDRRTIVFGLTHPVNETWFTDDELQLITPMPQHAWDKTSVDGVIGNYDRTAAGAVAVFNFLNQQAMVLTTYATNQLWQVVDGPWRLVSFTPQGTATFAANPRYSGPIKPSISRFEELPFSSQAKEFAALRAGTVDIGYLPFGRLAQKTTLESTGYRLAPWYNLAVGYALYNFANPVVGRILSQLYVRQAVQRTEDQARIVKKVFGGYALATVGPVGRTPRSDLVSAYVRSDPNRFDIGAVRGLLQDHGWKVRPGSADICEKPGRGPGHCGLGIVRGSKLSFELLYPSGSELAAREADSIKSTAAMAGIDITLVAHSFVDVVSTVGRCPSACNWQLAFFGVPSYEPVLPTGENSFLPGSPLNLGGYRNASSTAAIKTLLRSSDPTAYFQYEDTVARQLPWLWLPTPAYQLTMIKKDLKGVDPLNAYLYLTPENYRYDG